MAFCRPHMDNKELKKIATEVRKDIINAIHSAKSGHPGGCLSIADILTFLYFEEMHVDPSRPKDPERDRLVLSKGHACPALYSVLAERNYFDKSWLLTLRRPHSILQGHPDMKKTPGIDMSSGSLGQGFSAACGIALAGKMDGKAYRVYAICGDGEIEEGQIWEACMFAGFHKLDNLTLIVDNNGLQIDGPIEDVCSPYPINKKLEAFNFNVLDIDGHDFDQIRDALKKARNTKDMPTAIIAHTVKGKGVSFMENKVEWHGKSPNDEETRIALNELSNGGAC